MHNHFRSCFLFLWANLTEIFQNIQLCKKISNSISALSFRRPTTYIFTLCYCIFIIYITIYDVSALLVFAHVFDFFFLFLNDKNELDFMDNASERWQQITKIYKRNKKRKKKSKLNEIESRHDYILYNDAFIILSERRK